jgi:hypothetical protein
MKSNRLKIIINKPKRDIFLFTTTPPNSVLWIPLVISEETDEWPVREGTVYKLKDKNNVTTEVSVKAVKRNNLIEWISKDKNYHCRYSFKSLDKNTTEMDYYEWVDKGDLDNPFTAGILDSLKFVIENQ